MPRLLRRGRIEDGVKVVGYKKARKEYFETLKAKHERSLTYWLRLRKGASVHEGYEIDEKCNDHGAAIQYCEDAIRALEMMDKEENRNGKTEE